MVSPTEFIGRRVGRFTITSHLASGGMAELFIARQEAAGGFEKDLVLKMLQEKYAENPRVLGMFLDEARLAAKLNHQNIVHVYDVNEADGVRYIAMEYIHGETVTDIVRRAIARGGFLPLEHAVQIVADAAAGLAYAHERRDAEGRAARIIHRDVSPSNILVTYEGVTKIVDFGIARVQDQIREESGMRPGKVSYMSPEQARSEAVDQRSDLFSLGVLLYEITVGRRLFRGPAAEVLKKICDEPIAPPTYVRRHYPPALELIVMKALEKRPADRHQSAAQLQSELLEFLESEGLKSGPLRLGHYMKDLFAADVGPSAGGRDDKSIASPPPQGSEASGVARSTSDDELEELDFDRRAPLVMRVLPRQGPASVLDGRAGAGMAHTAVGSRGLDVAMGASGLSARPAPTPADSATAAPAPLPAEPPLEAPADVPVAVEGSGDALAATRPGGEGEEGDESEEGEAGSEDSTRPGGAAAAEVSALVAAPTGGGGVPAWLIVLVLAATAIVVFLGLRW